MQCNFANPVGVGLLPRNVTGNYGDALSYLRIPYLGNACTLFHEQVTRTA